MNDHPQLIEHLAQVDSLFAPLRGPWDANRAAAIVERRDDYFQQGLPLPPSSSDAAERKANERRWDAMEGEGLVVFARRGGRRAAWRLSDAAEWRLRRFVTVSDWPELLTLMMAIKAHTDSGYVNAGYVPDWRIAFGPHGDDWTAKERGFIVNVEWLASPGLCRGWLTSWSDGCGSVGYALTDAGLAVLANPIPPKVEWPEYCSEANQSYETAFGASLAALRNSKRITTGHCAIPLSAGDWPDDGEAARIPGIFTKAGNVRTVKNMAAAIRKAKR
jgi:hypothetical protein